MWWVFLTILGGRGALRAASLRWRRYAAGAWRLARGKAAAGGWWWHVVGPREGRWRVEGKRGGRFRRSKPKKNGVYSLSFTKWRKMWGR
jgi:hypothetical protein